MFSLKEGGAEIERTIYLTKEGLKAKGAKEIPDGVLEEIAEGVTIDLFLPILVPRKWEEIEKQQPLV